MEHPEVDVSFRSSAHVEKAFLTDLKNKEPDSFDKVVEYHNALKEQVAKLDTDIEFVLHKHESDFLSAFKCQMFNLYSQLKELKKKCDENEVKLKRDQQLNEMQDKLDWFREEALQLSEKTHVYKKEADKWKAKAESLDDDRRFLEEQLKVAKKKIKDLEENRKQMTVEISSRSKSSSAHGRRYVPSSKGGLAIFEIIQKNQGKISEIYFEIEKYIKNIEERYEERISRMKNNLNEEKKRILNVSAYKSNEYFEHSELKSLFESCVREVRKEVSKRNTQNLFSQKFSKRSPSPSRADRNSLTASDKRKILEYVVSDEKVLKLLCDKLFPNKSLPQINLEKSEENIYEESSNLDEMLKQVNANTGNIFSPNKIKLFAIS